MQEIITRCIGGTKMKKKSKFIVIVLIVSLLGNISFGVSSYIKSSYTPDLDDQMILAEMTQMVLQSEQYKNIAIQEEVYAIKQGVNRFNVSNTSSVYNYEIYVQTEKQSYIFYCIDKKCSDVSNEGWTYSRYSEEEPLLPL